MSANDSFILSSLEETYKLSEATKKPALVIFGSDYCKFCNSLKQDILNKKLSPHIDKYIICYIDIKQKPDLKTHYKVSSIPDSRIFVNGKESKTTKGYVQNAYIQWLSQW